MNFNIKLYDKQSSQVLKRDSLEAIFVHIFICHAEFWWATYLKICFDFKMRRKIEFHHTVNWPHPNFKSLSRKGKFFLQDLWPKPNWKGYDLGSLLLKGALSDVGTLWGVRILLKYSSYIDNLMLQHQQWVRLYRPHTTSKIPGKTESVSRPFNA